MSLQIKIKCPLCKAKIPSDALRCSYCAGDLTTKEIKEKIIEQTSRNKKAALIFIVIFVVFLVWFIGSLSKNPPSSSKSSSSPAPINQSQKEKNPAFMLAIIETQNTSPPATLVKQFENLLDNLQRKCSEKNKERLSDYIVKGKELIEKDGGKTTLLEFAKAMDISIPESFTTMNCADIAALLVVMSKQQ